MIVCKTLESGGENGTAGFDAAGSAVEWCDGDEFGLFESLEGCFAVTWFESVGEEELIVSNAGIFSEKFDDEPGLFRCPGTIAAVGVEYVHFENFGGGLFDDFVNDFC